MNDHSGKIFTKKTISIATFFGGPLAAGFLISKNFKAFGDEESARKSIFWGLLCTLVLIGGFLIIPEHIYVRIPQALIPGIYTVIITMLVKRLQGQKIREFIAAGGQKASGWEAFGYGVAGMLVILAFSVLVTYSTPIEGYEKTIRVDANTKLYYSKEIEKEKAKIISLVINHSGFLDKNGVADLFLNIEDNTYMLRFIIEDPALISDSLVISDFNRLENYLEYNTKLDRKIEVGFYDNELEREYDLVEAEVYFEKNQDPVYHLLHYRLNNFQTIHHNVGMPLAEVKKVEKAIRRLKGYFPPNQVIDIIFINAENNYIIKFFVNKEFWTDKELIEKINATVEYIKDSGVERNMKLVLIDAATLEEIQL